MIVWHQSGEKYFGFLNEITEICFYNPHSFRHWLGRGRFASSKRVSKFTKLGQVNLVCLLPGDPNLYLFILKKLLFQPSARLIWHTSYPFYTDKRNFKTIWVNIWLASISKFFECIVTPIPEVRNILSKKLREDTILICHPITLIQSHDIECFNNGSLVFGFLGEKTKKKGFDRFIEIARLNKDYLFLAAGPGVKGTENFPKNFINIAPLDRKQVYKYLNSIDVLLVPSRRTQRWEELFGIVIIEALSLNKKVIATRHVGPEFISKYSDNLYLVEDDDSAWREMDFDHLLKKEYRPHNLEIFQVEYCLNIWKKLIGN